MVSFSYTEYKIKVFRTLLYVIGVKLYLKVNPPVVTNRSVCKVNFDLLASVYATRVKRANTADLRYLFEGVKVNVLGERESDYL